MSGCKSHVTAEKRISYKRIVFYSIIYGLKNIESGNTFTTLELEKP